MLLHLISRILKISRESDNSVYLLLNVNDVVNKSGWWVVKVDVQQSSSNIPFGNNNDVIVSFLTNGSKGDKGSRGFTGFRWIYWISRFTGLLVTGRGFLRCNRTTRSKRIYRIPGVHWTTKDLLDMVLKDLQDIRDLLVIRGRQGLQGDQRLQGVRGYTGYQGFGHRDYEDSE